MSSTLSCHCCQYVSRKQEIFSALTLELPTVSSTIEQLLANHWSLQDLIDDGDYCHECGAEKCQSKSLQLERWPQILVLHLKRWTVISQWPFVQKKNPANISFEVCLPVPGKILPYSLRAVVVHQGQAGGGHYIAIVRCQDNHWYYCDDFRPPRRVLVDEVLAAEAYMLFYEE